MRPKQQLNKWTQQSLAANIAAGEKYADMKPTVKRIPKDRLVYENQWESDIYKVNGQEIQTLKAVEIDGEIYKVTSREVSVEYGDMGHTYTAKSTHYFVETTVLGIKKKIDLNTVVPHTKVMAITWS